MEWGRNCKGWINFIKYYLTSEDFINTIQELVEPLQNQGQGLGIAPISHIVTVVAHEKLDVDIEASTTPETGYTIEQLQ